MAPDSPRHRLRILHISDLHERGPRESERFRRYRVLGGEAWEDNVAALLDDGPIDLVCFTGDAADWGKAEEFRAVTVFLRALLDRLALAPDRLFVIPGNHDIDRGVGADSWQGLRSALEAANDELPIARWIQGIGDPPPGFEPSWREEVLARQGAYRRWVHEELGRPELLPDRSAHGALGYRVTVVLPQLHHLPVHVIGLDTAWLCGQRHEQQQLRLTDAQVGALSSNADDGSPLDGLRVALMHHPFADLADAADCRQLLADRVDLVLRGHLHRTEIEMWADPDRRLPHFAAGCLYEGWAGDRYPNALQVITVGLDAEGRPLGGEARFRGWSERGHWYDDDSLYKENRNGRLSWSVARPAVRVAAGGNPYDPWTPATPPHFVGRTGVMRRLDAALEERRSVSIVGLRRIGKSSVLETWAKRAAEKGRVVKLLSGERREGVSIGSFVTAVTGLPAADNADAAAEALSAWVANVAPAGLPPLILVDELDGMLERFDVRFFERLRGMLGRIVLVVATRIEIDLIYKRLGLNSPFENRLQFEPLGLLEPEAAEEVIAWGRPPLGEHEAALMREWAGRHPSFLELLGRHLIDARDGETVDDALMRFQFEAAARLREVWRGLDEAEQDALRRNVSGEPVQRRSLKQRGLVTAEGAPFGRVLTEWLRELPA